VTPGATGELFAAQTCDSLLDVLTPFNALAYDPALCRAQAEQFSVACFRSKLLAYLAEVMHIPQSHEQLTLDV
jgi:hypothetical protein